MNQKNNPVSETFAKWRTDPEYVAAYEALEEEFALAAAFIREHAPAVTTQETQQAARQ